MQISDKNLFLYLEPDEEIVYQSEKTKDKHSKALRQNILFAILFAFGMLLPNEGDFFHIFSLCIAVLMIIIQVKFSYDYYCVNIYLTKKNIIIKNSFKTHFIPYNQIKFIDLSDNVGSHKFNQICICTQIGKKFCHCFINIAKLKEQVKKYYPEYYDDKYIETNKSKKILVAIIFIITYAITTLLCMIFFKSH